MKAFLGTGFGMLKLERYGGLAGYAYGVVALREVRLPQGLLPGRLEAVTNRLPIHYVF